VLRYPSACLIFQHISQGIYIILSYVACNVATSDTMSHLAIPIMSLFIDGTISGHPLTQSAGIRSGNDTKIIVLLGSLKRNGTNRNV
jgi:hypothetical protein